MTVLANPIILEQSHDICISEICTYDETENPVVVSGDHTNGLSQVLLVKEVQPDFKVLAEVVRVAAKGSTNLLKPLCKLP